MTTHRFKAGEVFAKIGKNFMTPEFLGYWRTDRYAIELSFGSWMDGSRIYGLTVRPIDGSDPTDEHDNLSGCHRSKADALAAIQGMGATLELKARDFDKW